jgi:hypothetical protein
MHIEVTVPDGVCGNWRVETFEVTERQAGFANLRAALGHRLEAVNAGSYKRLMRGQTVVMSNTPMEVRTHRELIWRAQGAVLINGLGLGMALTAILAKPSVTEVTVIERSPEVLALVGPSFSADPRVTLVEGDAFTYQPPRGKRYDCVWHDIWDYVMRSNLPEMTTLHRRYGRRTRWQESWAREECRHLGGCYA